jgi:hypothetical protein
MSVSLHQCQWSCVLNDDDDDDDDAQDAFAGGDHVQEVEMLQRRVRYSMMHFMLNLVMAVEAQLHSPHLLASLFSLATSPMSLSQLAWHMPWQEIVHCHFITGW